MPFMFQTAYGSQQLKNGPKEDFQVKTTGSNAYFQAKLWYISLHLK